MIPRAALGVLVLLVLGAALYLYLNRSRPVWLVEEQYLETWKKVLALPGSPLPDAEVLPLPPPGKRIPSYYYGYKIGSRLLVAEGETAPPVYEDLSQNLRSGDTLILALNPWLIFRKFTDPALSRAQVTGNQALPGGPLLLAGGEASGAWAWTAQLLQEAPGVFSEDPELWEETAARIRLDSRFQRGALTYSWGELWDILLGDGPAWIYAPLSRIRELPLYETNNLEADVFPVDETWPRFGLQAEILWAVPLGTAKNQKKLEGTAPWFHAVEPQTLLADTLGWLAAHWEAPPFNPVTASARIAWLRSSYLWTQP